MIGPLDGKNPSLKEQGARKPRILVAPLDWGLGHATRCIPLIRQLLDEDYEVWIAAEGSQEELLRSEFSTLPFLQLEGYRAKYARTKTGLLWQMLIQTPRFIKSIKKEHKWLKGILRTHPFDIIISDNRYGLWHPEIRSIFITHQLNIKSPIGKWSEAFIQKRNYRYINRFDECWIPDNKDINDGLAGELSHPQIAPQVPLRYIGPLSRFEQKGQKSNEGHLLIVISGPEPQRSIFENKIISQITNYVGTATIVRGLPGDHSIIPSTNMIRFYNHLPSQQLNDEMEKAEFVISRSGYSTIMDIATLQKKSILIPTPGQTEQEYLAQYLKEKQFAITSTQDDFLLEKCLENAKRFSYKFQTPGNTIRLQNLLNFIVK
jgi:uncharacterized protein (TIGR00661 family)